MCRTRVQPETAPEDAYRPGMFISSYRAVPVALYLGARVASLKVVGQRLDPRRQSLQRLGDRRVGRRRHRIRDAGAGADLLDVVGDQQRREQQLTGFGEAAERRMRVLGAAIDFGRDRAEMLLLAVAAGDIVAPAGDL